ncbi:hypothetical protein [Flavobacterium sp. B183]|uniref:hypothetical protein n=1 Tax=Flavobacterium sp. B183 TaxID=907046 RepID=UPI00201F1DEE|nr:hypothetical protein [Flavobacterium sp. B183]URC13107.1 hypothetical protein M4I44_01555 [Flavobacterium sp. B183]
MKFRKIDGKYLVYFIVIFLLTMGSELLSNLIILILLCTQFKELKVKISDLLLTILIPLILLPFYLYSLNEHLLRIILYVPRFLIIILVFRSFLSNVSYGLLRSILQMVFFIHCFIILLCAAYPPLNVFFNVILGKSFTSEFRISGLFSGYDLISFFTVLYLYGEYRCSDYKFNLFGYLQLLLGFAATLVTGRFGIVVYLVFFCIIFFKKITFYKIISLVLSGVILFFLFYQRIVLFYSTFLLLKDTIQLDDQETSTLSLEDYGSEVQDGMYSLSPLTLYEEAARPFKDITKYIFPNTIASVVDSGPTFIILNAGFILFFVLYFYYFKLIYRSFTGITFITILILIMDFKIRIMFTVLPAIWILVNLDRIKKYEYLHR